MKQPVVSKTKAALAPPKPKGQSMKFLGSLGEEVVTANDHMEAVKLRDLNFKVDPEFHSKFKVTAAAAGKSMKELLEECFDAWVKERQG